MTDPRFPDQWAVGASKALDGKGGDGLVFGSGTMGRAPTADPATKSRKVEKSEDTRPYSGFDRSTKVREKQILHMNNRNSLIPPYLRAQLVPAPPMSKNYLGKSIQRTYLMDEYPPEQVDMLGLVRGKRTRLLPNGQVLAVNHNPNRPYEYKDRTVHYFINTDDRDGTPRRQAATNLDPRRPMFDAKGYKMTTNVEHPYYLGEDGVAHVFRDTRAMAVPGAGVHDSQPDHKNDHKNDHKSMMIQTLPAKHEPERMVINPMVSKPVTPAATAAAPIGIRPVSSKWEDQQRPPPSSGGFSTDSFIRTWQTEDRNSAQLRKTKQYWQRQSWPGFCYNTRPLGGAAFPAPVRLS